MRQPPPFKSRGTLAHQTYPPPEAICWLYPHAHYDAIPLPCFPLQYNPQLVLISAGFDAALGDPLGGQAITPAGYGALTQDLLELAGGKVVLVLEGGYKWVQPTDRHCTPTSPPRHLYFTPPHPTSHHHALRHAPHPTSHHHCIPLHTTAYHYTPRTPPVLQSDTLEAIM
jgi:hypothetical protein